MIEQFLDYLRFEKNRSELTVQSYAKDLAAFEAYFRQLDAQMSWQTVDADVLRGWMERMMDKGNSATSVGRRLSAVRSLYRYALGRGLVSRDPSLMVRGPKKERPLPQFLKEGEMDCLIDDAAWGNGFRDVRARTVLMVFYETGIRLSELTGLDDASVDLETGQLKVLGKRNKQRIVPFGAELREALLRYQSVRNRTVDRLDDALFVTDKGARMSGAQVRYEVCKCLSRVSMLRKRSPHVLRHTFATAMLNHEAGIESVRMLLGHERLTTTEIYTHTTFEQLRRVYKDAHPRA